MDENSWSGTPTREVLLVDRYDAFPSDHIAVFLPKPTASISLYRDQDVPITKGCVAPKAY